MFCKNKLFQLPRTKLEQFSVIALLKLGTLDISKQWQFSIHSSQRIALNQKRFRTKKKKMSQIILKERTAHLASQIFFEEMLINKKTRLFHSSIHHQEHLFHRTLITRDFCPVNIAKFLRTVFLQNTSRSSHLQIFFKIGVLKSFANLSGKQLCWSLFLSLQLHKKSFFP